MSIKRIAGWSLAVLGACFLGIIIIGLVYAYCLFYVQGDADIACSRDNDGRLVIDLRPNWRVNWVYSVIVWSEGGSDVLWDIENIGRPENRRIIYGLIPSDSVQVTPAKGLAPDNILEGRVFYVGVEIGWNGPLPVSDSAYAKFLAHKDGSVEYLGKGNLKEGVDIEFPARYSNARKPQ